jgi:hypothetical protein
MFPPAVSGPYDLKSSASEELLVDMMEIILEVI